MKFKHSLILVVIFTCFVTKSFSQKRNYRITNGIGILAGITKLDITTDNFTTKQGDGFLGGLNATVDIPLKWYNISFGMQLSESNFGISGRPTTNSTSQEFIDYKLFAAQVALLVHVKVLPDIFTIDLGPMLQYNGNLELKEKSQESHYINNYDNLLAGDISNISQFNINGAIGASLGYKFIKLKAQYIYGFTNILKKLNTESLDTSGGNSSFTGNQNMLVLGALISF